MSTWKEEHETYKEQMYRKYGVVRENTNRMHEELDPNSVNSRARQAVRNYLDTHDIGVTYSYFTLILSNTLFKARRDMREEDIEEAVAEDPNFFTKYIAEAVDEALNPRRKPVQPSHRRVLFRRRRDFEG